MAYNRSQTNRYRIPKIIVGILILLIGGLLLTSSLPGFLLVGLIGWTGDSPMPIDYNIKVRLLTTGLFLSNAQLLFSGIQFLRNYVNRKTILSLVIGIAGLIFSFVYMSNQNSAMIAKSREINKISQESEIQKILENGVSLPIEYDNRKIVFSTKGAWAGDFYPVILKCPSSNLCEIGYFEINSIDKVKPIFVNYTKTAGNISIKQGEKEQVINLETLRSVDNSEGSENSEFLGCVNKQTESSRWRFDSKCAGFE